MIQSRFILISTLDMAVLCSSGHCCFNSTNKTFVLQERGANISELFTAKECIMENYRRNKKWGSKPPPLDILILVKFIGAVDCERSYQQDLPTKMDREVAYVKDILSQFMDQTTLDTRIKEQTEYYKFFMINPYLSSFSTFTLETVEAMRRWIKEKKLLYDKDAQLFANVTNDHTKQYDMYMQKLLTIFPTPEEAKRMPKEKVQQMIASLKNEIDYLNGVMQEKLSLLERVRGLLRSAPTQPDSAPTVQNNESLTTTEPKDDK